MVELVIINVTFLFQQKYSLVVNTPLKRIPTHHALFQPGLFMCITFGAW